LTPQSDFLQRDPRARSTGMSAAPRFAREVAGLENALGATS
jgi:hypothetical protein